MRALKYLGLGCILLLGAGLLVCFLLLRASLPRLDGALRGAGLTAPVRIARDARGVPTIEAANRNDLAYATGFLHAQDRFFEMDLSRRLAAGELAELVGAVALAQDRETRLFRFRHIAREVIAAATPAQRSLLEAYARGVNAGLAALGSRPWEYWVLGEKPAPWRPEDTALVVYTMWWDLQANGLRRELLREEINARLGGPVCGGWKCALSFLYPAGTNWDAPAGGPGGAGATPPGAPIPGPEALNLRAAPISAALPGGAEPAEGAGSNNWALAGRLTDTGAALIASDMHLMQRVPTTWYHARLKTTATATAPGLDLTGVTLPGAPLLVAGSNGHIAWGFTNSYGDWITVEAMPCSESSEREVTVSGAPLWLVREEIRIRGAQAQWLEVRSGPAGVLLRRETQQSRCWFGAWLAQLPAATNLKLEELEQVGSVADALTLAPEVGIPHQNLVVGDREGHIGWAIFGRIPADTDAARARGGAPWTTASDHPRIMDPELGRLWSANARVAADPQQQQLIGGHVAGFGAQYVVGARARQIRDDLLALHSPATPEDMLQVQLDDRAVFLERWRTLLLELLDAKVTEGQPRRAEFRRLIDDWNARASVDSVGYRLVRTYRNGTERAVWEMLLRALEIPPADGIEIPGQFEGPLWQLVTARPLHLLGKPYASWPEFLLARVDSTIDELERSCSPLARCTWGAHNEVRIRHPLAAAFPWLGGFLNMPALELPGDHYMPRVEDGAFGAAERAFGASERFAVSPGHEERGYLVLAGGQSGHPLSPYYRAGFLDWAQGKPLPFLPGASQHSLTLTPD